MSRSLFYIVVFISLVGCHMSNSTDFSNVFDGSGGPLRIVAFVPSSSPVIY